MGTQRELTWNVHSLQCIIFTRSNLPGVTIISCHRLIPATCWQIILCREFVGWLLPRVHNNIYYYELLLLLWSRWRWQNFYWYQQSVGESHLMCVHNSLCMKNLDHCSRLVVSDPSHNLQRVRCHQTGLQWHAILYLSHMWSKMVD